MVAEGGENFELMLRQHVDHFAPSDGVEFGMVEEMASSYWRLRRAWAIETRMLDDAFNAQTSGSDQLDCITAGFKDLAAQPSLQLLLRYQASLHRAYTRALHNLLLLRANYETNPVPKSDTDDDPPLTPPSSCNESTSSGGTPPRGAAPLSGDPGASGADLPVCLALPAHLSAQSAPAPESQPTSSPHTALYQSVMSQGSPERMKTPPMWGGQSWLPPASAGVRDGSTRPRAA
jgi:hypothetical protein